MKRTQRIALLGILTAAALILGWIESMIPFVPYVPGIKLGLGNITVVIALYKLGRSDALVLSISKVLLSTLLFGSFSGLLYSAAGAAASYLVMCLIYKVRHFSPIGVSAAGGAAHIIAQLFVAVLMTDTVQIWRFLPLLMAVGCVTGALTGFAALLLINKVKWRSF